MSGKCPKAAGFSLGPGLPVPSLDRLPAGHMDKSEPRPWPERAGEGRRKPLRTPPADSPSPAPREGGSGVRAGRLLWGQIWGGLACAGRWGDRLLLAQTPDATPR